MIHERGLLLGGGGVVGLAWEIGLLHGLASAGIDLLAADEVIGTSAGAFAGAALLDPRGLAWACGRQRGEHVEEIAAELSPAVVAALTTVLTDRELSAEEAGRRLGVFAKSARTVMPAARMAVVRARLDRADWPSDRLRMTAIDADTGALHLLDQASGIDLASAAAASGAVPGIWPVVEAGGVRWIDGGSVAVTNVPLAARMRRCLIVSPIATNFSGLAVADEVSALPATVSTRLIVPDAASLDAIGSNPFDATRRPAAAEAGDRQGRAAAAGIAGWWGPA